MDVFEAILALLTLILRITVFDSVVLVICKVLASARHGNRGRLHQEVRPALTVDGTGMDTPDARGVNPSGESTLNRPTDRRQSVPGLMYSGAVSDCYKMNHARRGQALIINNKTFDPSLEMGIRKGTEIDAQSLHALFNDMGFISTTKPDCTAKTMMDLMSEVAKQDHADEDCFVCVILTHGDPGLVYATDDKVDIDDLLAPLKTCRSLAGKPKIIIIQACRGEKLDEGQDVVDARGAAEDEEDTEPVVYRVPVEADFLMAFACVPGYYAWRNEKEGSWFVQALVDVWRANWDRMDILTMMTRVCKRVALDFESTNTGRRKYLHKKQVPCISSMLTRDLYFPPQTTSVRRAAV